MGDCLVLRGSCSGGLAQAEACGYESGGALRQIIFSVVLGTELLAGVRGRGFLIFLGRGLLMSDTFDGIHG